MKFRSFYRQVLPGVVSRQLARLERAFFASAFVRRQEAVLARLGQPARVMAGPFENMRYGPHTADKALLSRLIGTYEMETYPAVEEIIAREPDVVVVAGAGEGYFAVGMARRLPRSRVIGFELGRWGRYLTGRHAEANDVAARVEVRSNCTSETLRNTLADAGRPALVCDIEGGERTVLDPATVPDLRRTAMLVELHPMYVEGIEELLKTRFAPSHDISMMRMQERRLSDLPASCLERLDEEEALWAVDEVMFRGPTGLWMLLLPRASASA